MKPRALASSPPRGAIEVVSASEEADLLHRQHLHRNGSRRPQGAGGDSLPRPTKPPSDGGGCGRAAGSIRGLLPPLPRTSSWCPSRARRSCWSSRRRFGKARASRSGCAFCAAQRSACRGILRASGEGIQLPHSAFLKIQDGCDCRCAYCRVPLARGTR
ncbi:MAG: hypothetical protein MZV64_28625 [Ignavibacteriales bacterium]|nr:hypothetical protein [Ignavibacteriales bacterium]